MMGRNRPMQRSRLSALGSRLLNGWKPRSLPGTARAGVGFDALDEAKQHLSGGTQLGLNGSKVFAAQEAQVARKDRVVQAFARRAERNLETPLPVRVGCTAARLRDIRPDRRRRTAQL